MKDLKLPWWRRALGFALSGIRSGFGLFSRSQQVQDEEPDHPEFVAGQEETPEEDTELNKHPLRVEPTAEDPRETEAGSAIAPPPEAEVQTEPLHESVAETAIEPSAAEESAEAAGEDPREDEPLQRQSEKEDEETVSVPEPEAKADVEEALEEVSAIADDPLPKLADSSVELSEPTLEEASGQSAALPAPDQAEMTDQADVIEAVPQEATPEAGQRTVELPEHGVEPVEDAVNGSENRADYEAVDQPLDESIDEPGDELTDEIVEEPMELREPIPEPPAEQSAACETPSPNETQPAGAQPEEAESQTVPQAAPPTADEEPALKPQPAPDKPFIKLESRDNEADLSPFSVVVSQVYDGPLDLLLDLIRKQDIDIYDIPIARITAQFLAYVNQLKAADVDVAGEFIYTASLLIHIKSKMLLPRAQSGPEEAAEDPRRELVERLLEHERFKNAAQMLQQKQMLEAASWTNPGLREFKDDEAAEPEIAADTVDLVRIFRDILERARNRPVINVEEDAVTVGQMIQFLARRLTMEDKPVALRRLLSHTQSERALIAMFLALLELVRLQAILLRQDRAFSEIFIKKHTGFESVMNDGLDRARDDWQ